MEDPPTPTPDRIDQAIAAWIEAEIRNSPIAQATSAWNHLMAALPKLAEILKEL